MYSNPSLSQYKVFFGRGIMALRLFNHFGNRRNRDISDSNIFRKIKPFFKNSLFRKGFGSKISEKLSHITGELEDICTNAESEFLNLSQELENINSDATDLARKTLDAVGRIGDSSRDGVLKKISDFAGYSLSELKRCQIDTDESLSRIDAIANHLGNLPQTGADIEKVAMMLRVVGLNMDIESSRSTMAQENFMAVIKEIAQLSDKVITIAKNIRKDARFAQMLQLSARKDITRGLDKLSILTQEAQGVVGNAVDKINGIMKISMTALKQAGTHAEIISEKVSDVVVGIQFHDAMCQRVDHVRQAFDDIRNRIERMGNSASGPEDIKTIRAVVEVQIAQLVQIIAEIEAIYHKNVQAFGIIGDEVDQLSHSISDFEEERADGFSQKNLQKGFSELESAFSNLERLLTQGRDLIKHLKETSVRASETATYLADYMREIRQISFRAKLVALNAIVKAAHLDSYGVTLEVLAQATVRLSIHANQLVIAVETITDRIIHAVRNFEIEHRQEKISHHLQENSSSISAATEISVIYKRFKSDSQQVVTTSDKLKTAISHAKKNLGFLLHVSDSIKKHIQELEKITHKLTPREDIKHVELTDNTAVLLERYTMQTERDVHNKIIGNTDDTPIESDDKDADEALGENVELF